MNSKTNHRLHQLSRFWRLPTSIVGGLVSSLAFPREGLWPLIFVSVILLLGAIRGLRFWSATLVGFAGGFAFYASQIEWMSLYLGPVPWLALSILEGIIFALGMGLIAMIWAWLEHRARGTFKNLIIAAAIACAWTAREWVSINVPYGGFPWSRLAQTQSTSFLADWVYVGGLPLLTFVIAFIAALTFGFRLATVRGKIISVLAMATALIIPALIVVPAAAESGTYVVAAVQGNANAGLFANTERGSILENHIEASKLIGDQPLADEIDVVVWPENASDLSPFKDVAASTTIQNLVNDEFKVPLIFGTITERGDKIFNSSILWEPGVGPTDCYEKKRPVPFAEYVPDRDFWYQFAPDLIGLISRGYSFGDRDGIFEVNGTKLGTLICFEIAIDDIGRNLVGDGAELILSQTNNADFGQSDETFQQAALARLRAIETGRSLVNISTVGVSEIYAADGTILASLPTFEPGVMVTEVPLRTSITPAMVIGPIFDLANNAVAFLLGALAIGYRARRKARDHVDTVELDEPRKQEGNTQ